MFHKFQPILLHTLATAKPAIKKPFFTRIKLAAGFACGFTYIAYRQGKERYRQMHFANMYETLPDTEILTQQYFGEKNLVRRSFYCRFKDYIKRQIRTLHLIIKFFPLAITLPIALIFKKLLFTHWLQFLLYTLNSAGPLWIKLGQWASHRGDIFGIEITRALEKLRDQAPPHHPKENHHQFEESFGKKIYDVFEFFNEQPIASGSIAQVHKARLNGETVAVKIRHPNIIENLEMDIKIAYSWANVLSRFIPSIAMPITFEEFKKTLVSQTDLRFEARNLHQFNLKFEKHPHIFFPKPIEPYNSASVLTETFESGIPLQHFLDSERGPEHQKIANLGLKSFYKMLIYDNFIHADCHAGNIFIRLSEKKNEELSTWESMNKWVEDCQDSIYEGIDKGVQTIFTKYADWQMQKNTNLQQKEQTQNVSILSIILKLNILHQEKKKDEKHFTSFLKSAESQEVEIVFLDPGMVTILNKNDRAAFLKLVMYVTLRKPDECGQLMLQLSTYDQKRKLKTETKERFMKSMRELFAKECEVPLSKMNIGLVLRSMLEILRQNGMSIEGHFAALLTNMIVLEGLVKELDPEVNIVAKAASFLLHLRTIDKTIDEIIQQAL